MAKTALEITKEDMAVYRATAQRQQEVERQALRRRARRARQLAEQAAQILKKQFGARRVILFGSLASGDFFHQRSDIDLAVQGLKAQDFWRAWAALDQLGAEFEIDLVDIETTPAHLREHIDRQGVEI